MASAQAAITILTMQVHALRQFGQAEPFFEQQLLPLVQTILEESLTLDLGRESFKWDEILAIFGHSDPITSIRLAVSALTCENHRWMPEQTGRYLTAISPKYPQAVMDAIGTALLEPESGWRLRTYDLKPVIAALPISTTMAWIKQKGVTGAQVIARILPSPYVQDGSPIVPELTKFVLDRFGDDSKVFREFCKGTDSYDGGLGDIAKEFDSNALKARVFFTHPCPKIGEWARRYERVARANAGLFRIVDEDYEAP